MNNENEKKVTGTPEELVAAETEEAVLQEEAALQEEVALLEESTVPAEETAVVEKTTEKEKTAKKNAPKKSGKKFWNNPNFRHGGMATAFTAGFIVVIILLNTVVSLLGERFPSMNIDITQGSMNTLSEDAVEVVDAVALPTTITILANQDDVESDAVLSSYGFKYSQVGILAAKMAERNSNIKVEYVDLDQNPTYANSFPGESISSGCVVVATERRHRILQITDLFNMETNYQTYESTSYSMVDGALAAAVSQANSETMPIVAFATGHNEMIDMSAFKTVLAGGSFETVDFNLLTEEVPENAQMVVLATPSTDYTDDELKKLDAFLSNTELEADRTLLITFHPGQEDLPKLNNFLSEWGMEVPQAVIAETDGSKLTQNNPYYILTQTGVDSEIDLGGETDDYGYVVMPMSRPVNLLFTSQDGVSTHALTASYDSSSLVDEAVLNQGGEPQQGSYNTLAVGQRYRSINNRSYKQCVMVSGSSAFWSNGFINASTYGNNKYALDLVRYATGTTDSDTYYIKKVETNTADITLTAAASNILGLGVFTIGIPLCLLLAGLVVYLRRRHL